MIRTNKIDTTEGGLNTPSLFSIEENFIELQNMKVSEVVVFRDKEGFLCLIYSIPIASWGGFPLVCMSKFTEYDLLSFQSLSKIDVSLKERGSFIKLNKCDLNEEDLKTTMNTPPEDSHRGGIQSTILQNNNVLNINGKRFLIGAEPDNYSLVPFEGTVRKDNDTKAAA